MLCVPTFFDSPHPPVFYEQPARADDEPGAGQ
jgi:hypothetical protein